MTFLTRAAALARSISWRWIAFPVVVLLGFIILVGLDLNGSSVSVVTGSHAGLVAGTPRSIRSDEYIVKTPVAVSSERQDFPDKAWIGLSKIDQSTVTDGGPVKDWITLFKPQDWGYFVFGISRGVAVSWWAPYVICLIGCYALLGVLTRRPLLSALLAIIATFTPTMGWWTAPAPGLFIGYAGLTGACLIAAWEVGRRWVAATLAVLAGVFAVAFVVGLYPPWQVSIGLVLTALCVGWAIDGRIGWRRFAWPLILGLAVSGIVLGAWYGQHSAAISAQTATIYPGHRLSDSGGASPSALVDAPLNFWFTHTAGMTLGQPAYGSGVPGNLSEAASSWLPLPVAALIVLGILELLGRRLLGDRPLFAGGSGRAARRSVDDNAPPTAVTGQVSEGDSDGGEPEVEAPPERRTPIWTLSLVAATLLLLLGWALLPLPSFVGKITLLDRVEPVRTPVALGFALLLLAAVAMTVPRRGRPVAWSWPLLIAAAVITAGVTVLAKRHLPWHEAAVSSVLVLLSGLAVGLTFAGLLHARAAFVSAAVLVVYAVVSWLPINPLQRGVAPLTDAPLVRHLVSMTKGTNNPRTEVFFTQTRSLAATADVRAAGLQSLTGVTFYPDKTLMTALAPTQERLWNNYVHYMWVAAPTGTQALITQVNGTLMRLTIAPCDPVLLAGAKPGWVVSDQPLTASCLTPAGQVETGPSAVWLYRVRG